MWYSAWIGYINSIVMESKTVKQFLSCTNKSIKHSHYWIELKSSFAWWSILRIYCLCVLSFLYSWTLLYENYWNDYGACRRPRQNHRPKWICKLFTSGTFQFNVENAKCAPICRKIILYAFGEVRLLIALLLTANEITPIKYSSSF